PGTGSPWAAAGAGTLVAPEGSRLARRFVGTMVCRRRAGGGAAGRGRLRGGGDPGLGPVGPLDPGPRAGRVRPGYRRRGRFALCAADRRLLVPVRIFPLVPAAADGVQNRRALV